MVVHLERASRVGAELDEVGARVVAGRPMERGRHQRIDLPRRSENGPGRGADLDAATSTDNTR
jgi:hypothetical protein